MKSDAISSAGARLSGRGADTLRHISFDLGVAQHAEGSCLIRMGDTHVLCVASLEPRVPLWLRGQGRGWITAEYGMLPRATHTRMRREAVAGRQSGRTQEIQRLIGRALRAVSDLEKLDEQQISIDCDVLQADGGTRTASITGAWLALAQCLQTLGLFDAVLCDHVAAVSCGILGGRAMIDLDYAEDSTADVDANFVITGGGQLVEVQASAEGSIFSRSDFEVMLDLASKSILDLIAAQKDALARLV